MEWVSEMGGHLGLFVGASLMTLAEVVEFFMTALESLCAKAAKVRPRKNVG